MTNGNTRVVLIKESGMERTSTPEYMENSPHSPTDSSEDSVEVKVEAITNRSKRKLAEPRRINDASAPLKKRICIRAEESAPFRPWNTSSPNEHAKLYLAPTHIEEPQRHAYFRPPSPIRSASPQPVDLIKPKEPEITRIKQEPELRIPLHPSHSDSSQETESALCSSLANFPKLHSRKEQRNYKNMTRERRIEANARERTRVHTISAAFDTLRKSVPAYSHSQKLSKLSVLRIACSYIMTLSNMLEDSPDTLDSVECVSRTIQREGKLRKKKDED